MQKIMKEPLLHFIVLGAVFFIVYGLFNTGQTKDEIIIDDIELNRMVSLWETQWRRSPTPEELGSIVEQHIRQEIFYKEALRMNLDHNDEVVKRRMAQKMDFLSNDLNALVAAPSESKLQLFYDKHKDDYKKTDSYSFHQVIFSPELHEDNVAHAASVLKENGQASVEVMQTKGDPLPLPFNYDDVDTDRLKAELGENFSSSLNEMPLNMWAGPINSVFGVHLIYMTIKEEGRIPEISEIKEELQREYTFEREQETRDMIYEELKGNYSIMIQAENLDVKVKEQLLEKLSGAL